MNRIFLNQYRVTLEDLAASGGLPPHTGSLPAKGLNWELQRAESERNTGTPSFQFFAFRLLFSVGS